jgi:hypothetical protein
MRNSPPFRHWDNRMDALPSVIRIQRIAPAQRTARSLTREWVHHHRPASVLLTPVSRVRGKCRLP